MTAFEYCYFCGDKTKFGAANCAVILRAGKTLLQSQTGPFASQTITTILLVHRISGFSFLLDPLSAHPATCVQSGVLRARGGPSERAAAARICREGGTRHHQQYSARAWPRIVTWRTCFFCKIFTTIPSLDVYKTHVVCVS